MSDDRLTRQELGWLLMQEARGTARALREEVGQLKLNPERPSDRPVPVDTMFDALDGAIEMIGALDSPHPPTSAGQDRRGRIDVAGLLFDIAPDARIAIEPGAGTEVLGSPGELRRMLSVLIGHPGDSFAMMPTSVHLRRDGDWVIISAELGPEGPRARDLELRWLNRMAVHHAGRVEYGGGSIRLYLPADVSSQREIELLRQELSEAQELGAVYAKELAEAFATRGPSAAAPTSVIPVSSERVDLLISVATALSRSLHPTTDALRTDLTRVARILGDTHEAVSELSRRIGTLLETVGELDRVSHTLLVEPKELVNLASATSDAIARTEARAAKMEVTLKPVEGPDHPVLVDVQPSLLALLLRTVLEQAVAASPMQSEVVTAVSTLEDGSAQIAVSDGGPVVPESAYLPLLRGHADPSALGRPGGMGWLVVGAASQALQARLEFGESAQRRAELRVVLDRKK